MTKILLVGCGKMGSALLRGWRKDETLDVLIVCPSPKTESVHVAWLDTPDKIALDYRPDIVVLAVKPQQMADVLPAYACFASSLFLSIAAGQTITRLAHLLGQPQIAILRAMPNLPAQVAQGATAVTANAFVTEAHKALADKLLAAIGTIEWLEDESLIDAVTALSGSGPAYIFALCEAMAAAGEKLGLDPELAVRLARQTVIGSGALLAKSCASASELRVAVTSPGGTTAAALDHLLATDKGLPRLLEQAMQAACARAHELSD